MAELKYLADLHISPLTVNALQASDLIIQRVADRSLSAGKRFRNRDACTPARPDHTDAGPGFLSFDSQVRETRPSVISLRLQHASPTRVTQLLLSILPSLQKDLIEGAIVSIDEGGIRIRMLLVK